MSHGGPHGPPVIVVLWLFIAVAWSVVLCVLLACCDACNDGPTNRRRRGHCDTLFSLPHLLAQATIYLQFLGFLSLVVALICVGLHVLALIFLLISVVDPDSAQECQYCCQRDSVDGYLQACTTRCTACCTECPWERCIKPEESTVGSAAVVAPATGPGTDSGASCARSGLHWLARLFFCVVLLVCVVGASLPNQGWGSYLALARQRSSVVSETSLNERVQVGWLCCDPVRPVTVNGTRDTLITQDFQGTKKDGGQYALAGCIVGAIAAAVGLSALFPATRRGSAWRIRLAGWTSCVALTTAGVMFYQLTYANLGVRASPSYSFHTRNRTVGVVYVMVLVAAGLALVAAELAYWTKACCGRRPSVAGAGIAPSSSTGQRDLGADDPDDQGGSVQCTVSIPPET